MLASIDAKGAPIAVLTRRLKIGETGVTGGVTTGGVTTGGGVTIGDAIPDPPPPPPHAGSTAKETAAKAIAKNAFHENQVLNKLIYN